MASTDKYYPDYLNPFGDDNEDQQHDGSCNAIKTPAAEIKQKQPKQTDNDEYPDYLSPFGDDDNNGVSGTSATVDDYDDSLNPFGDERVDDNKQVDCVETNQDEESPDNPFNESNNNPFDECEEEDISTAHHDEAITRQIPDKQATSQLLQSINLVQPLESLEPPPVPLPRTKSLLKKEQAQKNRQRQHLASEQTNSLISNTSSASSSSIANSTVNVITPATTTSTSTSTTITGSFQRKKNKRNAPPVPINFKRQVSGSFDAIEEELNNIGDKLAILEKESSACQENLKATHQIDEARFESSRTEYIELIKRKNSIVRRQKELMYRKRELKLDQIHSDIEYELRMIGNKQLSNRTAEDETREKELLKRLVEIVEEKSDIVENLNKDTSCDSQDIEEAFRRLNITVESPKKSESVGVKNSSDVEIKNATCDKSSVALGTKLSKIATLLPKSGTIKGTMKFKRKRLFKKCDPRPIER